MTRKEIFEAIAQGQMNEEIQNFAITELARMEADKAKRKATPTKAQIANMELAQIVLDYLKPDVEYTGRDIVNFQIDGIASVSKASAVFKTLIAQGKVGVRKGTAIYTDENGKLQKRAGVNLYTLIEN